MKRVLFAVAALGLVGCTKTPAYLYGRDIENLTFELYSANVGIYPDTSILDDPNNPFATDPPTDQGKWVIESSAGPIAAFYSWATLDAINPTGEEQYYTAHDLEQVFRTGQNGTAKSTITQTMAIRGYQSVLDNFPESVTYDVTGKIAYSLSTMAYEGIVGLGGMVQGGWILVTADDGSKHAVKP